MTMTKREFREKYATQLSEYEKAVAGCDAVAIRYWEIVILSLLKKAGL